MMSYAPSLKAKAAAELERRRRTNTAGGALSFADFIRRVHPRYLHYKHCQELIAVLQRVADGEIARLMVFMPPRHSKSETISRLFSAYYLYRHPSRFVGLASYGAELAYTLSRSARDHYTHAGGKMRSDAGAVKHWETTAGGGLWAAGVGGPITGKGFHLGIIDDPLKDAEEAASAVIRTKHKEWYASTFSTRQEPGAQIVILQTRWHEDDLSGYLLTLEEDEPESWYVVNMPAIAGDMQPFPPTCAVHPDWRESGAALCPERYPLERLQKIARRIGDYFFQSLFQQHPRPREGMMFKAGRVQFVDVAPVNARRVRRWDIAASAGTGDYSSGVLEAWEAPGIVYIEDVVRGQWAGDERDRIMRETAELDRVRGNVVQLVPQDPGAAGKDQAAHFLRLLGGFTVEVERESGDKVTRADPFASQWNGGNVRIVRNEKWNQAYLDELYAFPQGKNDDQVDGSSGAYNKLANTPSLIPRPPTVTRRG